MEFLGPLCFLAGVGALLARVFRISQAPPGAVYQAAGLVLMTFEHVVPLTPGVSVAMKTVGGLIVIGGGLRLIRDSTSDH